MKGLQLFSKALVLTLILTSLYELNGYKTGYTMYFVFGIITTIAIGKGE